MFFILINLLIDLMFLSLYFHVLKKLIMIRKYASKNVFFKEFIFPLFFSFISFQITVNYLKMVEINHYTT